MKKLLQAGADPDMTDPEGMTAVDILKREYPEKYESCVIDI